MAKVTAIVLAAGLSRRMGKENKLFLPFGNSTIVETVIQKIEDSIAANLVIVSSQFSIEKLKRFSNERTVVVDNPDYETGMTSSIKSGVSTAPDTDGFMICLGDQPLIETEIYNNMITKFKQELKSDPGVIAVPFYKGVKGNPVIFSKVYKGDILLHEPPEGCKEIVQANKKHISKIDLSTSSILADIDTKEDFERYS